MIKIETIVSSLSNFKEQSYKLPTESKFTQKTAYHMKVDELEQIFNSTDSELEDYIKSSINKHNDTPDDIHNSLEQPITYNTNNNNNNTNTNNNIMV